MALIGQQILDDEQRLNDAADALVAACRALITSLERSIGIDSAPTLAAEVKAVDQEGQS